MALPLLTSPEDIRTLVKFLGRKPAGSSLKDTEAILGAELVDQRKLATCVRLGIITRDNEHLKLTPNIGRELSRLSESEFSTRLRDLLGSLPAYSACLEWAYENGLEALSSADVGAFWHDHHRDELGTTNERQIAERATCFLKLCEGGGLGSYVVGRKGQPTRLDVDKDALEAFVHTREFAIADGCTANGATLAAESEKNGDFGERKLANHSAEENGSATSPPLGQAIFVGHGKNKTPLNQLKGILDQFKIPFKVAVDEPNLGRPISDKVAQVMRQCNCAILIFSADEEFLDKDGKSIWRPSENVVHEFGASGLLYGKRIVVLKEDSVKLPTNFSDIGYISFAPDELAAKAMDVLKELIGFGIVKVST
jgi:predicted nucleotide-binding protein